MIGNASAKFVVFLATKGAIFINMEANLWLWGGKRGTIKKKKKQISLQYAVSHFKFHFGKWQVRLSRQTDVPSGEKSKLWRIFYNLRVSTKDFYTLITTI